MGVLGPAGAWPRAGGAVLYASRRLAAAGHSCSALTWIGNDEDADHFLNACQKAAIRQDAIEQCNDTRTTRCIMLYNADGSSGCLLDVGLGGTERLSNAQRASVKCADVVCITVGPPDITQDIIQLCPKDAVVAWIAKIDNTAVPEDVRKLIAARADIIFCNASEREFVEAARTDKTRTGQIIIETLGSAGVLIDGKTKIVVPAEIVQTSDTTGAGDTLAGEVLAQLSIDGTRIEDAVEAGMKAARTLLANRPPLN